MSSTTRSSYTRGPASIFSSSVETDANSIHGAEPASRNLTDVPEEEGHDVPPPVPSSPYITTSPPASTSTFNMSAKAPRKPTSARTLGRTSNDQLGSASTVTAVKRAASASSAAVPSTGTANNIRAPRSTSSTSSTQKFRASPRLPHDKDAQPASSTIMHWSRAPVWGSIPTRTMRAHTVTLVDTTAWLFGGCDDKDSSKDIYCFDTGAQIFSIIKSGVYFPHFSTPRCACYRSSRLRPFHYMSPNHLIYY